MMTYKYRIYYEWRGPSASDIFATEKSPEDLDRTFDQFPAELEHRLEDGDAVARIERTEATPKEGVLTVVTTASEDQLREALISTLQDWRLFGSRLE